MQESWWWIAGSGVAAFIMWAAQVSPKQAVSNAAEWVISLGFRNPPDWLKSPDADSVVRHTSALLFSIFTLYGISQFFEVQNMRPEPKILYMLGCAFICGSVLWSWSGKYAGGSPVDERPSTAEAKTGSVVTVNTEVIRAPNYNRTQLDHLVEAIDIFYPIVLDLDRELESGEGVAKSMEALILHNGAKAYLTQMDTLRLSLNDALERLHRAKEQQGLYQEVCDIVANSSNFSDPFYSSWNELAGILRDIPDNLNARSLSIFVSGKKETFVSLVSEFHQWAKQKKMELIERRKFYLRQEAQIAQTMKPEPYPKNTTIDQRVNSISQSGGITAHTVNVNPKYQRALGDSIREKLLKNVPRDKLVVVWATHGDQESFRYANEIFQFLKASGFNLFGDAPQGNIFTQPLYGVTVTPQDDKTEIYIGMLSESEKPVAK
jgi:hypothetical protein